MAQKYITRDNETIFDIAIRTGIGMENIVQFSINNSIDSLNESLNASIELEYEPVTNITKTAPITQPQDVVLIYNSREGQSLFDIALMLKGGIENIVEFAISSGIDSVTDTIKVKTGFSYVDAKLALTNWINKNEYVFATGPERITTSTVRYLLQQNGFYILQQNGDKIII